MTPVFQVSIQMESMLIQMDTKPCGSVQSTNY